MHDDDFDALCQYLASGYDISAMLTIRHDSASNLLASKIYDTMRATARHLQSECTPQQRDKLSGIIIDILA